MNILFYELFGKQIICYGRSGVYIKCMYLEIILFENAKDFEISPSYQGIKILKCKYKDKSIYSGTLF